MKTRDVLAVFNRGRVSRLAQARTDVARVALSAEIQTNWMPRALGSMMLRPGLEYMETLPDDGVDIPFIFSNTDTALIELTPGLLRVAVSGEHIVQRSGARATISNGTFDTDLSSWTDHDESGAASTWVSGRMQLLGTGTTSARRRQAVVTTTQTSEHAVRVHVARGPLLLRVGTTAGADDIVPQAVLRTGWHSIAFVPNGNFHIEFSSFLTRPVLIESCVMESAGIMSLPTPWADVETCKAVRWQQVGDVVFVACDGVQQRRIERRANNSWSVVLYEPDDGPFLIENVSSTLLTPSALSGAITISASRATFKAGHVGALFRIASQGQRVQSDLLSVLSFTNEIRVTGVESSRIFTVNISGTWSGTLSLQRSIADIGSWVTIKTFTANGTTSEDDGLDNSIAFYRIGFEAGNYTSGTADVSLEYAAGSITGTARVTDFSSETSVSAVVIEDFGGTDPTDVWFEGAWSDVNGWPSAVALAEGRLWWSGGGRNYGSLPDGLDVFDPEIIGDSQPINRLVGDGMLGATAWMLPMQQLIAGTPAGEISIRSTSFEEPLTPSNYNAKARTTKGSALVPAVKADNTGFFVGRTGTQVFELSYDPSAYGYNATNSMLLVPEIGAAGVERLAIQQSPDMRLHAVMSDGTVSLLVRDSAEDVTCWVNVETNGVIEGASVLPGLQEDRVFYRVRRTVNGSTVRFRERIALESEARGGTVNKQADSFVTGTGEVTGLGHLEGETVVVWADGEDQGAFVVGDGAIGQTFGSWMAGLPYDGMFKSAKLAGQTQMGLSLTQRSRINKIGLILADTHARGVSYGPDFEVMDDLPLMESGAAVDPDAVWESYDQDQIEFPGDWSTDSRVCLKASAPRPCTVLAVVLNVDRQDAD